MNGKMLGDKRCETLGEICDHCRRYINIIVNQRSNNDEYQAEEHEPWREDDYCEESRYGLGGKLLCRSEGMVDFRKRRKRGLVRVYAWRR